jgi:hypothetical protein
MDDESVSKIDDGLCGVHRFCSPIQILKYNGGSFASASVTGS